jgi:hypothetical protein
MTPTTSRRPPVDVDATADDRSVGAESHPPEFVKQDDRPWSHVDVGGGEGTADCGICLEYVESAYGEARAEYLFASVVVCEDEASW